MNQRQADGPLPRTRSCFVCGVENPHGLGAQPRVEDGRVVVDYMPREADCGYRGVVHGGLAMTLLDEVMTWAAILTARRMCVAGELTVRLLRPMEAGVTYRVEGRADEARGRLVFAAGSVLDPSGAEMARAAGKYMPMKPALSEKCAKDFLPGPELDAWAERMRPIA